MRKTLVSTLFPVLFAHVSRSQIFCSDLNLKVFCLEMAQFIAESGGNFDLVSTNSVDAKRHTSKMQSSHYTFAIVALVNYNHRLGCLCGKRGKKRWKRHIIAQDFRTSKRICIFASEIINHEEAFVVVFPARSSNDNGWS